MDSLAFDFPDYAKFTMLKVQEMDILESPGHL